MCFILFSLVCCLLIFLYLSFALSNVFLRFEYVVKMFAVAVVAVECLRLSARVLFINFAPINWSIGRRRLRRCVMLAVTREPKKVKPYTVYTTNCVQSKRYPSKLNAHCRFYCNRNAIYRTEIKCSSSCVPISVSGCFVWLFLARDSCGI